MKITFGPRGILEIEDARIIYRNFSGAAGKYNREGDRNFLLVITDEDIKDQLVKDGWNVKIKPPREEGDTPLMYLPVKVKFNDRGPIVYLITGRKKNQLDEETVDILDKIDIACIDMVIRPFDWEVNGKEGRAAYLQKIYVTQEVDRFAEKYAEEESPSETPW